MKNIIVNAFWKSFCISFGSRLLRWACFPHRHLFEWEIRRQCKLIYKSIKAAWRKCRNWISRYERKTTGNSKHTEAMGEDELKLMMNKSKLRSSPITLSNSETATIREELPIGTNRRDSVRNIYLPSEWDIVEFPRAGVSTPVCFIFVISMNLSRLWKQNTPCTTHYSKTNDTLWGELKENVLKTAWIESNSVRTPWYRHNRRCMPCYMTIGLSI